MIEVITSASAGMNGGVTVWIVVIAVMRSAVSNIVSLLDLEPSGSQQRAVAGDQAVLPDGCAEVGCGGVDDDGLVDALAGQHGAYEIGERDLVRPADVDDSV